ncbi:MAG: type II toxin-antitoxin system HicA family toxin [Chloroflexi bacterium]|nr:type II toxin-antitoxin system HicA family toxin [Chloroflexota bacterium]
MWWNPANRRFTTIPRGKSDIPKGTFSAILRDLGFTIADFTGR